MVDDDQVAANGYCNHIETARALPAGVYRFTDRVEANRHAPCKSKPDNNGLRRVGTVMAPIEAVYESFFDPVVIGSAAGTDATKRRVEAGFILGSGNWFSYYQESTS